MESQSANIELELPAAAKFSLEATAARGRTENEFGDSIQVEDRGKSTEMRGGSSSGPRIRLSTPRGAVSLKKIR